MITEEDTLFMIAGVGWALALLLLAIFLPKVLFGMIVFACLVLIVKKIKRIK